LRVKRSPQSSRRNERGEGRLKALLYLVFLIAAVVTAVKVVPSYVNEYQLKDKMGEQARFAVVNHWTDDQIRDNIYKVIDDLEIPAKREDIKVNHTHSGLTITVSYAIPVDFYVYKTDLKFTPTCDGLDIMK
jgi:hypothetical protein